MKGFTGVAIAAAAVAAGVTAQPHNHQHQHLHRQAKHQAEKRGMVVVTQVVEGPVVTEYVLSGNKLDDKKAKDGLKKGMYVVVGTSEPSFTAPPPALETKPSVKAAQFFEDKKDNETPSSSAEPPKKSDVTPPTGGGLNAEFPSGKIPCSKVPTDYGAIEIDWIQNGGWTTLMLTGGPLVAGKLLDNIHQANDAKCGPRRLCSYACPPGYQKTQWPEENQGATGQSVGGLYCNDDGFLELTRPNFKTLCEQGAGGIFVRNELSSNAAICRTDYPGNEEMNIPLNTQPGQTYPLTNPVSSRYYKWQNKPTTAQYYANNEGVEVSEACRWKSSKFPDSAGNWAPVNIGVGMDDHDITYLSIFPNLPTSHAVLNYDIEIEGDFSGECWLRSGVYSKPNGCTVGVKKGQTATLVFKKSKN